MNDGQRFSPLLIRGVLTAEAVNENLLLIKKFAGDVYSFINKNVVFVGPGTAAGSTLGPFPPERIPFGALSGSGLLSTDARLLMDPTRGQIIVPAGSIGTGTPPTDTATPGIAFTGSSGNDGFLYDSATQNVLLRLRNGIWYSFNVNDLTMSSVNARFFLGIDGGVGILREQDCLVLFAGGDVSLGASSIQSTGDVTGFVDLRYMLGVPTGFPTTQRVGHLSTVIDATHNRWYVRNVGNTTWMPLGQYTGSFGPAILQTDASGIWTALTIGTGLSYSGGTLSVSGFVTNVTASAPITSSGGATPNIAITDFVASGASHARGAVPDPGATPGTAKFLREDATWATPPGTGVTSVGATAPVQSSGGTTPTISLHIDNTTIVNGAGTLERGHVTGDVDIPAGNNTATVQAITETSGPTSLAIAGIPASTPNDTVLVRGSGSSTVSGVASTNLRTRVEIFYFCSIPSLQPVNTANQQLATTNETPFSSGVTTNPIEYPIDFKATQVYFELYLIASIGAATTVDVWVTRNGTQIAATKITFTPGTTGLGIITAGPASTGSGASTDTYGVQMVYNGNPVTGPFGAQLAYTARVLLTAS